MMSDTVEILLSTYNGANYLPVQLDSILQQDYPYWKLLIRDDGSTDDTLKIIQEYIQKYPGKITLINGDSGNVGYAGSFSKLLKYSTAEYVMFCDQDDYWYPNKISTLLSVMVEQEVELPSKAHAVFSDLEVADANLNIISDSFLKKTGYNPRKGSRIFFLKNYVPGCSMLFNKTLVQLALKTDNLIGLHDLWLLMVASCCGKLTFVPKPLVKYRIHAHNAIGFMEADSTLLHKLSLFIKDNLKYGFANKKYRDILYSKNISQVQQICERLPQQVSKEAMTFAAIDHSNYLSRKIKNVTHPYMLSPSLLKQLTYIICF